MLRPTRSRIVSTYPQRPAFFAHKVVRLLFKTCAAQDIGQTATLLVTFVAHTEDAKRYTAPPTFHNDQLLPILGVKKWDTVDRARREAVDAGWLQYIPAPQGSRKPGTYWTTIPEEFGEIGDAPIGAEQYPVNGERSDEEPGERYPPNGKREEERYPLNGDGRGKGRGDSMGELPTLDLSPDPKPISSSRERDEGGETSKTPKTKNHKFTEADRETAQWMFSKIQAINPGHKPPNLNAWANDVRLIRERDGRTDEKIRELFTWANADDFWRSNILSPAKLRKQWDTLTIRRHDRNDRHNGHGRNRSQSGGAGQTGRNGRQSSTVGVSNSSRVHERDYSDLDPT